MCHFVCLSVWMSVYSDKLPHRSRTCGTADTSEMPWTQTIWKSFAFTELGWYKTYQRVKYYKIFRTLTTVHSQHWWPVIFLIWHGLLVKSLIKILIWSLVSIKPLILCVIGWRQDLWCVLLSVSGVVQHHVSIHSIQSLHGFGDLVRTYKITKVNK